MSRNRRRHWAGALAASACALIPGLVLPSGPAAAQTPGSAGLLAVMRTGTATSPGGVFTMRPDGSDVQQVWSGDDARTPTFSPDGARIALADRAPDGQRRLWSISTAGGDVRQLTTGSVGAAHPSWSPDGTEVAFSGSDDRLYAVAADGSGEQRVVTDPGCLNGNAWSPDGATIYLAECSGSHDIQRVDSRGGDPTPVTATPEREMYVDVSPDGRALAVTGWAAEQPEQDAPMHVWLMAADGSDRRLVHTGRGVRHPRFSPDGTRLAFVADDSTTPHIDYDSRTHILDLATGSVTLVPSDLSGEWQEYGVGWQPLPASVPTQDRTGPSVDVTSPRSALGRAYSLGEVVRAEYACSDDTDPAPLCQGSVPDGEPVDTATPGTRTFTVTAEDASGNRTVSAVEYVVLAGDLSTQVVGGSTVTTDPGGVGATSDVPVQTAITVPAGVSGPLSVTTQPAPTPAPVGFTLFDQSLAIDAPAATADAPYTVAFTVDATLLGQVAPGDVQVWRTADGASEPTRLLDCTDPVKAVPDPCVAARTTADGGDARITVRTSHFSAWTLGALDYDLTGPFQPVDAYPTVNTAKAGSAVPVKFKLGGDRGLDVFSAGHPRVLTSSCTGPSDAVESTTSATTSALTYDAVSATYTYTWKTPKSATGCKELALTMRDGSVLRAAFRLR